MDFGLNSVFVCCIGLEFSYRGIFMDLGHIPVLEYCFGLISAIFTEWDSIQCSCVVLVLNSKHIYIDWDSFQHASTVLVLFQLYSLNGTQFSAHVLLWS